MRNRTVLGGNYGISRQTLLVCEGHGSRDHQPIKGYLEPGLSRSDYVRGSHSTLARGLVKDFLGGLYLQSAGCSAEADSGRRKQRNILMQIAEATDAGLGTDLDLPELHSSSDEEEEFEEPEAQGMLATSRSKAKTKAAPKPKVAPKAPAPAIAAAVAEAVAPPPPAAEPGKGKATCPGCLDKEGKAAHVKDESCQKFRHAKAMRKWQEKKKLQDKLDHRARVEQAGAGVPAWAPEGGPASSSTARPPGFDEEELMEMDPGEELEEEQEEEAEAATEGAAAARPGSKKRPRLKSKGSEDEVVLVPEVLPRGPLLRALMHGGPPAIKATKELHRRWDHMPIAEMQALYKRANLDPVLIKEIPVVLKDCRICGMWQKLPARQIARSSFAQRFNEKVWLDLFFCTIFCEGDPRDCTSLHMLDEATYVCLLPLLAGRTFGAIKMGFCNWSGF